MAQDSTEYFVDGYFVSESSGLEDLVSVNKEPILVGTDTFQYQIHGNQFIIYLQEFIDTTWFQNDDEDVFFFVDTIYKQKSLGQPNPREIQFQINETRIDSTFDPDDPFVILAIDTVLPPHDVKHSSDFFFLINRKRKINSELIWGKELAISHPGLEFGLIQINTFNNRIFVKGSISDLPDLVNEIWNDSSESIILYGYTISPKHKKYPDLDFHIHLLRD